MQEVDLISVINESISSQDNAAAKLVLRGYTACSSRVGHHTGSVFLTELNPKILTRFGSLPEADWS